MKTPETPSVPWKEFWGTGYQLTEGDTLHTHTPHTPYTPETPSALCTFGGGGERWRPRRHKPRLHTSPSYTLEKATSTHTHRHTDTHRHTHTHTHNGEPLWLRRPSSEGPEDVNGPPFIYRFSRRPPPPPLPFLYPSLHLCRSIRMTFDFLLFLRLVSSRCSSCSSSQSTSPSSHFSRLRCCFWPSLDAKKKQWNTTKGN